MSNDHLCLNTVETLLPGTQVTVTARVTKKINHATCRMSIAAAPIHMEHAKIDYNLNAVPMHRLERLISEHAEINLKAISTSPLRRIATAPLGKHRNK